MYKNGLCAAMVLFSICISYADLAREKMVKQFERALGRKTVVTLSGSLAES